MTAVPFVDLPAQYASLREEILIGFDAICSTGRFVLGPAVESFERDFASFCEVRHCVGVNSGTSALHLALQVLGLGPGDEVITVPMTFVATVWAISYVGAAPVLVDIEPKTRTLDPERLRQAITPRTRAIVPVHLYGQPADMEPILEIANEFGIPVIEDACQAHGAHYQGRRAGGLGRIGCFSFYPGKNLGAYGEAGALVTNDPSLADQARMLRDHAQRERYRHETVGYNYRMDALQAVVLNARLPRLDTWNAQRQRHALCYYERLQDVPGLALPAVDPNRDSVHHLFVIELDDRDRVAGFLRARGIQTGLHYPVPVHLQPAYRSLGLGPGALAGDDGVRP
jgi:dTDP-4-amino-4,6-dideoxygalactose transaminase